MRVRIMLGIAAVGGMLGLAAPAAHALTIAHNCTTPTTGTNTAPNRTCWVAGAYNDAYTGMADVNYVGAAYQSGRYRFTGVTDFTVSNTGGMPDGTVQTVRVDIPPGTVSNPLATPKCSDARLVAGTCPANTQLGIVKLEAFLGVPVYAGASVYNMPVESSQCSGYVSDFAFYVAATKSRVNICGSVNRQPPYNQYFTIAISGAQTVSSTLIFWGIPGDSGHNPDRGWSCLQTMPCIPPATSPGTPSGTPFISNPTACQPAGQVSTLTLTPTSGPPVTATSDTPIPVTGCSSLAFSPKLKLRLKGRSQTGVGKHPTLIANVTQAPRQANIGTSVVRLPLSLALDPRNSQHVCPPLAAFNDTCSSKTLIGTARAITPLLSRPLTGKVYLVQGIRCSSGQPPTLQGTCSSGSRLRTEPALLVALRGQAMLDLHAQTSVVHNKLVTTFFNLPDLPDSSFQLTINGGKRGILVVTGHKSLCKSKHQVAGTVLTGKNGAKRNRNLKIATPCKK